MFALSALAIALTVVSSTAASSASQKNTSLEYLLSLTSSPGGRPDDAPIEFSCAWRRYATAYAMQIHPKLSAAKQRALHDALQLSGLCNQSFAVKPRHHNLTTRTVATTPTNGRKIYVNPTNGSNSGTGSQTAPLKTLHAAVAASRIPAHSVSDAPTIILCGGVYYLANHEAKGTVVLTPSDSGLTIQAMEGETPILSGGRALTSLKWSPLAQNARAVALHNAFRTTLSTADAAALPVGGGGAMPALHSEIGNRYTLARYPNANAELDLFPAGHIIDKTGTAWMTPRYNGTRCTSDGQECGQAKDVIWSAPQDEWHGMYQDYMVGVGGACDAYEPPYSPWCAQHFYAERWSEMHYRHPAGITPNATTLPHFPYKNATGAVLHVWRPGHWYTWMFEVNATTAAAKQINMTFGRGGNQGGEGSDTGDEWWIENVPEELDAANEYYYDPATRTLDIVVNTTTDGTSPGATLVVPTLATLIELRGTQQSPVTNVTLLGLVFTASRPTFFDPRANPSGGDWALERLGALLVEGANSLTVRDCNFTRLDSNAISMNGYTRDVVIDRNHFEWLGQNAIASWGRSNYFNGTDGNFPRGTVVTSNWAIEVGILQKQSSFYFQAETAETTLANNIVFNIPRAAINFNDGFGGGAKMHDNLLFNTCRESSDHGAFNSWDRLPYLTTVRNGTASTVPAMNEVYRNFIVANYAADGGCLDNDDGSSYYDIHHNFCVYGGHKADFDGHTKFSRFNVHVYPSVYASTCVGELQALPKPGYAERYTDNVCILPTGKSSYLSLNIPGQCDGTNLSIATFHAGMVTRNNTIYVPGGAATVVCNHVTYNASSFMQGATISQRNDFNWTAKAGTMPQIVPTHASDAADWKYSGGAANTASRLPGKTDIRSGGPGETSLALVDHMLWSEGHLINALSVSFQYVSGYGCIPPTTGGGSCDGAANISLAIVDAVNKSIVRIVWDSPPLGKYSYDAFKGYSPPVSSGAVSHLAVGWPRQTQLALIIRNNKRNLQIPVNSINLTLAWGGKQISPWSPASSWRTREGYDTTSRVSGDVPSAAGIIAMAKNLLS